jgi:magnesium chelatase family protein
VLIAAMNPCPCGYYGDAERACCASRPATPTITRYQRRISVPTPRRTISCSSEQARIDAPRSVWAAEVSRVDEAKLTSDHLGEPSEAVRAVRRALKAPRATPCPTGAA